MSTILKALKKLEQETQAAAATALPSVDADTYARPGSRRRKHIWIGIGSVTGILGLGLVFFLFLPPNEPSTNTLPQGQPVPAAPPLKTEAPLPMPEVFPPPQPGDRKSPSPDPVQANSVGESGIDPAQRSIQPQTAPLQKASKPTQSTKPTTSGVRKPRPATLTPPPRRGEKVAPASSGSPPPPASEPSPAVTEKNSPPDASAAVDSAPKAAGDSQAAEPPKTSENSQASADPFANVPPLEANSPLKLQAISWEERTDKSITVINNSILHEGDQVEGYTVLKIRPDDVILRRSGRLWRATFSIR